MKKSLIIIAAIVIVVVGTRAIMRGYKAPVASGDPQAASVAGVVAPADVPATDASVKEFTVTGSNFAFDPATMTVQKGDKVRVVFKNADGFHDFRIDELGVATKKIKGGAEEAVEFTADKAGTFEYYCSVGSHRAMGMNGTLIVQ